MGPLRSGDLGGPSWRPGLFTRCRDAAGYKPALYWPGTDTCGSSARTEAAVERDPPVCAGPIPSGPVAGTSVHHRVRTRSNPAVVRQQDDGGRRKVRPRRGNQCLRSADRHRIPLRFAPFRGMAIRRNRGTAAFHREIGSGVGRVSDPGVPYPQPRRFAVTSRSARSR